MTAVFSKAKTGNTEAVADNAVGDRITSDAGDPLLADIKLRAVEPWLREDLHESGVRV